MNLLTFEESEHIILKYVPKLGKGNQTDIIFNIKDNIKKFFNNPQESGTFTSRHLLIKIKKVKLSQDFVQNIITVNIRYDKDYVKDNELTQLQKNILGYPLHSIVIRNNFPHKLSPLIEHCVKNKNMLFTDEQIIFNNCNSIVPAILIYVIHHMDNIVSLCYQHIGNQKVNKDGFTNMYKKYIEAVEKHEEKIERERLEKERAEKARIQKEKEEAEKAKQEALDKKKKDDKYKNKIPDYLNKVNVNHVKLSPEEYDNYCTLSEKDQVLYLKKREYIQGKCGKVKPLFRTKTYKPKTPEPKPKPEEKSNNTVWNWFDKDSKDKEKDKEKETKKLKTDEIKPNTSLLEKYAQEKGSTSIYKSKSLPTQSDNRISYASMSEHAHLNEAHQEYTVKNKATVI